MIQTEVLDKFRSILKSEGLKLTPQRLKILEEVIGNDGHRECEEIYFSLKTAGNNISRATIYRTMDILVKYDFARKLEIGDGRARYETKVNHPHHDHMICISCGNIYEFVNAQIEKLQDDVCDKNGFKLIRHIHQLFGLCRKCNK